jgi:single-stranded DNA-binding protein
VIVNTVTLEGVLTADPAINASAGESPVCIAELMVERPTVRGEGQPPFYLTFVVRGELANHVVASAREAYRVLVAGRLDVFVWSADDGSHRCEPGIAATSVEVLDTVPF